MASAPHPAPAAAAATTAAGERCAKGACAAYVELAEGALRSAVGNKRGRAGTCALDVSRRNAGARSTAQGSALPKPGACSTALGAERGRGLGAGGGLSTGPKHLGSAKSGVKGAAATAGLAGHSEDPACISVMGGRRDIQGTCHGLRRMVYFFCSICG